MTLIAIVSRTAARRIYGAVRRVHLSATTPSHKQGCRGLMRGACCLQRLEGVHVVRSNWRGCMLSAAMGGGACSLSHRCPSLPFWTMVSGGGCPCERERLHWERHPECWMDGRVQISWHCTAGRCTPVVEHAAMEHHELLLPPPAADACWTACWYAHYSLGHSYTEAVQSPPPLLFRSSVAGASLLSPLPRGWPSHDTPPLWLVVPHGGLGGGADQQPLAGP